MGPAKPAPNKLRGMTRKKLQKMGLHTLASIWSTEKSPPPVRLTSADIPPIDGGVDPLAGSFDMKLLKKRGNFARFLRGAKLPA